MLSVKEIHQLAIDTAVKADPRGKEGVDRFLKIQKRLFDNFKEKEKVFFDQERITNPYMDSSRFAPCNRRSAD